MILNRQLNVGRYDVLLALKIHWHLERQYMLYAEITACDKYELINHACTI